MDNLANRLIKIRRQIHMYPELGNQEFKTACLIEKTLRVSGIKTKRISKTGITALITGRKKIKKNKCIALRGDIDALPIQEKTGKPYTSKVKGVMHACGHDANTTMVLGSALLLNEMKNEFGGSVKFVFQPNEEYSGGAQQMIRGGVLKNPKVDAIMGVHVYPMLKTKIIGLKYGEMMAAVDKFKIRIYGECGHGAYPHLSKDPIVAASQIITSLQTIVSREIDPVEPVVISIGKIKGGERFNVLAGKVSMSGTVRTLSSQIHRSIPKLMKKRIDSICRAYGVRYDFEYQTLGYPLKNSIKYVELCRKTVTKMKNIGYKMLSVPSMGGEDFAEYLRRVPGCFVYIGAGKGSCYPWHHEKFIIDENALFVGASFLAQTAKEYLK